MHQQHNYAAGIKETCFEIYTKQVPCPLDLPLLNISICQSVSKYHYVEMFIFTWQLYHQQMLLLRLNVARIEVSFLMHCIIT